MSARLLDGNALAKRIRQSLFPRVSTLKAALGRAPRLAVVGSYGDAPSAAYRKASVKACKSSEIETESHTLPGNATPAQAQDLLGKLVADPGVDGIILDLPLPAGVDAKTLLAALPPEKDAEGLTPARYGRLFLARSMDELRAAKLIAPPTALAVAELLQETGLPLAGLKAVVAGRSNILGKPAAHLLTCLDLTVTLCHSRTKSLEEAVRGADALVLCLGRPRSIPGAWLKKGAVVIDAGTTSVDGTLAGDLDFDSAQDAASFITPVPGGVGPVTTAMLLANTVLLAEARRLRSA